jgi:hypothetical protein
MRKFNPYTRPSSKLSISQDRKSLGVRKEASIIIIAALLMTFICWLPYATTILVNWHLNANEEPLSFLTYQVLLFRATGEFINSYFYLVIPAFLPVALILRFILLHFNKLVTLASAVYGVIYIFSFILLLLSKSYGLGIGLIGISTSFYYFIFLPSMLISIWIISPKKDHNPWHIFLFIAIGITMFEIGNWVMWQHRLMSH